VATEYVNFKNSQQACGF